MAGEVNVGTVETVLTLLDQMSGPLAEATKNLDKFNAVQGQTPPAVKKTEDALTAAGVAFANWGANYLVKATDAIVNFAKESGMAAAQVEQLTVVAEFMGAKWGLTKDEVHAVTGALNKQGITMKQANDTVIQFVKSNLDLGKASQLAGLAQSAARVANINSSDALSRLIHGITTMQSETLRGVGIMVSSEKASAEYAKTLGKAASALSPAERQQAMFNAVLKEGEKLNGVYAVTNTTVAGAMKSFERHVEDAKAALGTAFLPVMRLAVDAAGSFFKAIKEHPDLFLKLGAAIAFAGLAIQISWLLPVTLALGALDLLVGAFTGTLDPITNFKALIGFIADVLNWLVDAIKTVSFGFVDFKAAFSSVEVVAFAFKIVFNEITLVLNLVKLGLLSVAAGAFDLEASLSRLAAKATFGKMREDLLAHADAAEKRAASFRKDSEAVAQNIEELKKQHEAIMSGTDAVKKQKQSKAELDALNASVAAKSAAHLKQLDDEAKKAALAAEETKRHASAVKKLMETLSDAGRAKHAAQALGDVQGTIASIGGVSKLSEGEVFRFSEEMSKSGEKGRDAAAKMKQAWTDAQGGLVLLTNQARSFNTLMATPPKQQSNDEKIDAAAAKIKADLDAQTEAVDIQKAAYDRLYRDNLINGSQYEEALRRLMPATTAVAAATDTWSQKLKGVLEGAMMLANVLGGGLFSDLAQGMSASIQSFDSYKSTMGDIDKKYAGVTDKAGLAAKAQAQFVAKTDLAANAAGLLGGMLAKSSNATMQQAGAALQAGAAGAKMGASFGPIGAIVGGVGGAILGFLSAGKKLKAEVTKLYDDFVKTAGGIDKLKESTKAAGISLDEVMKNKGTKNVAAMKKAIEEAKDKLDAFKGLADKVGVSTLKELEIKAKSAGISLQKMFDAKNAEEYRAAVEAVQKQFDLVAQANEKLNSAMEKYGITVDQLGPKMRQQKLDEQAASLYEDWMILLGAGVDMNVLIDKMGPAMMDYVNTAVQAGATIPSAMKPALQAMFDQGKLLHANGDAYTQAEFDAINYGKTQAEMFDSLIEKITALVNALLGIPSEVNTDVNVNTHNRSDNQGGDDGTQDHGARQQHASGSGGFKDFGTGTPAVLHGVERVQTYGQARAEWASSAPAEISEASMARLTDALKKSFRDSVLKGI